MRQLSRIDRFQCQSVKVFFSLCQMMPWRKVVLIKIFYIIFSKSFVLNFSSLFEMLCPSAEYVLCYQWSNILGGRNAKRYSGHRLTNAYLANGQKVLSHRISCEDAGERCCFTPEMFSLPLGRDSEYLIMGTTLKWCVKQRYKIPYLSIF